MKKILIQLIGHQTIPNVVPLYVLRPDAVYHLCTKETLPIGHRIEKWMKNNPITAYISHHLKKIQGAEKHQETLDICRELMQKYPDAQFVVNMTGGTKLMSLAAYQSAAQRGNTPVVYVEPERSKDYAEMLVWVEKAEMRESLTKGYAPSLKLKVDDFLALGEQAYKPQKSADWHRLIPAAKAVQRYADDLKDSKWEIKPLLNRVRQVPTLQDSFKAAKVEFDFKHPAGGVKGNSFLTGNWWEVLVADYLEKSGRFIDVACSVSTLISQSAGETEIDVLATDGITLTCISCKRQLQKPDSEINKHESRSRKLGGARVKCGLAVYEGTYESFVALQKLAEASCFELMFGYTVCPDKTKPALPGPPQSQPAVISELEDILPPLTGSLADSFMMPR